MRTAILGVMWTAQPVFAGLIFVNPGDSGTTPDHPVRAWTDSEKAIVNEALREWSKVIGMIDVHLGNWTLRWEDTGLFKNWGTGCDLSGLGGVTISSWEGCPSPPKDSKDFPVREIYFRTDRPWYFDPTPATDEPGEVPGEQFDFLTRAKHELGHALGITSGGIDGQGHLADGGAMKDPLNSGERQRVSAKDIELARAQGGDLAKWVVPEPSTLTLIAAEIAALLGLHLVQLRHKLKSPLAAAPSENLLRAMPGAAISPPAVPTTIR